MNKSLLLTAGFTVVATAMAKQNTAKPNIVYILADDWGYGDVSCLNPESKLNTKHTDQLAKEGMIFS